MKLAKRICAGFIASAILTALVPTTIADASTRSTCFRHGARERQFAQLMNKARGRRNASRLQLDRHLSRVARKHTLEMRRRNSLFHTPSAKLRRRVTRWSVLGENVGVGNTVKSLHRAFMLSPAHRANILYRRFNHVGVGVRRTATGRLWVTVVFQSRRNPGTRLPMPPC